MAFNDYDMVHCDVQMPVAQGASLSATPALAATSNTENGALESYDG